MLRGRRLPTLLLLLACCPPAGADPGSNTSDDATLRVTLHDGTTLDGEVRFRKTKLEVRGRRRKKVAYGDISTLSVVPGPTREELLEQLERRRARIGDGDAEGWVKLGRWAEERGLAEEAFAAFEKAVELAPDDEAARRGVGQIRNEEAGEGDDVWIDGAAYLSRLRRDVADEDSDGLIELARVALRHGLQEEAFRYVVSVLRNDVYHKDALRLAKPRTEAHEQKTPLVLPVRGRWKLSDDKSRHHQRKCYAVYAIDFLKVDEEGRHHAGSGRDLDDHYCFGAPFYAVAPGRVIEVRDGYPDNPVGKIPPGVAEKHNGLSIDHGNGELSWYVHAKKGSFKVKVGDTVERGQVLGEVGNSGASAVPHLHYTLVSYGGLSVPWTCDDYLLIAEDGTPIRVERAWPREGWIVEGKEPPPAAPPPPETAGSE